MRILILANSQRGLYLFRKELILQLREEGHEIGISVPDGECIPFFQGAGCTFFPTEINRRGINLKEDKELLNAYRKQIRAYKPDLIITYTIKPNIYGGISARTSLTSYAANITGLGTAFQNKGLIRWIAVHLYRVALRKAKVVFFENAESQRDALSYRICREEQTHVLNGAGVNLTSFPYCPYPHNDVFHFLFVGRIMKEKGMDELLAAIRQLKEEGESCVLDIVGDYEEDYREIIHRMAQEGAVIYHGQQEDVRMYYEDCDCFILPSWHEGMANTNLEAAATGRPIITSDIPGCIEAVTEGESGLLCRPKDTESLTGAMRKMLSIPAAEREAMGRAGREHMEKVFDKKKVVAETIKALI